ncbi:hypothetical protein SAMN04515617_1368 [Collimonas sp. OK242]|nr:hypothetical protein SAMN04515617_1368 [Collimonas sp. OK242]
MKACLRQRTIKTMNTVCAMTVPISMVSTSDCIVYWADLAAALFNTGIEAAAIKTAKVRYFI